MNYRFAYKNRFEKRNLNQKLNKLFSNLIFFLYDNWFFKKLKLDRNQFLKAHVNFWKNKPIYEINKSTIPLNPKLNVYSITLLDCIELEDSQLFKNRLIKIISRYKEGFLSNDPVSELNKAFEKFDSTYKNTSWRKLYYNDTRDNKELDLIDGILYGYIKGQQSHFIITYTIFPSDKFKELFRESLNSEKTEEFEIKFNSLKQSIKSKRLIKSIAHNVKREDYWTDKLFNEITYQFKREVISSLKLGVINLDDNILFPRITSFEYDKIEMQEYQNELFQKLDIGRHDYYTDSNIILTLKNVDYSRKSAYGIEIFIPHKTFEEKQQDQFNNVAYLPNYYVQAISPFWTLINISNLRKNNIVNLRKKTFKYIRKNKISLFLRESLKIKNKLLLEWISFERIRKDFTSEIFKLQLNFYNIPDLFNIPLIENAQPKEFKKSIANLSKRESDDIKKNYEEIIELLSHISEDNSLRASMKLQQIILIISVIGIILSIYGSNSDWCNAWIEYF